MSIDKRTPNIYAVQLPESPETVRVIRAMSALAARGLIENELGGPVSVSKIGSALALSSIEPEQMAELPFDSVSQHFEA
mgnify:CR=1 FL=1